VWRWRQTHLFAVDEALRDARAFVDKALGQLRQRGLIDSSSPG
jgi:hypothetical protein